MTGLLSYLSDPIEMARREVRQTEERKREAAEQIQREAAAAEEERRLELLGCMNDVLQRKLVAELTLELDYRMKPYKDATRRAYVSDFNRFKERAKEWALTVGAPRAP